MRSLFVSVTCKKKVKCHEKHEIKRDSSISIQVAFLIVHFLTSEAGQ